MISENDTATLAKKNIKEIIENGKQVKRRVGSWCMKQHKMEVLHEIPPIIFELKDITKIVSSQHVLPVEIETQDYMLGLNPGYIHQSSWSFYKNWITQTGKYHYTYGERGGVYIPEIIKRIHAAPTSRQIVINLWDAGKGDLRTSFVPCTTQWQFSFDGDYLDMSTVMRSQDACRGFFLDTFAYPIIQQLICKILKLKPGKYRHIILNSHIYHDDIGFAELILKRIRHEHTTKIDAISFEDMVMLKRAAKHLYENLDTETAESISNMLPEFWRLWFANQIIYIYTKHIKKDMTPTELTVAGAKSVFSVRPEMVVNAE